MKPVYDREYDLLVIGETMMEFSCDGDILKSDSFSTDIGGGDVVVAVAAARLGAKVRLISAIAHDQFHGFIRERLTSQGVDISLVLTCQQCYNGLYFTSAKYPEYREYLVHHPGTASRHIVPTLVNPEYVEDTKIVYASSELQSVSPQARRTIFNTFLFAHTNKIMVAYDPNLRLQRWSLEDARESLWSVLSLVDVFFVSSPEESKALLGFDRPLDVVGFLWNNGVSTVVVKMGAGGCMVGHDKNIKVFTQPGEDAGIAPFTTPTLVGSAFNGAFLNNIAKGYNPFEAAEMANSAALFKGIKGRGVDSLPSVDDLTR
jgi:sugar/nucleoside kinase (ribokinase family)